MATVPVISASAVSTDRVFDEEMRLLAEARALVCWNKIWRIKEELREVQVDISELEPKLDAAWTRETELKEELAELEAQEALPHKPR